MDVERKTDNFTMMVFLEATKDIIGLNGLKSVLNYAKLGKYIDNMPPDNEELAIPLADLQGFLLSLNELFGSRGARSLQLRVGRELFRFGIQKRPTVSKTLQFAARLLPENKRIHLVLEELAKYDWKAFSSHLREPPFELMEKEDCFLLIEKDRFESEGIASQIPVCGTLAGTIEAMVEWITGHPHKVEEIECRAMGFSREMFRIEKARKVD